MDNYLKLKNYRALIFDLFHTLTSVTLNRMKHQGTKDILGVSREDWNDQLLLYSKDRLIGRIRDPYEIIRKMAHAIDPEIPEKTIRKAAENRLSRFKYALKYIDPDVLRTLKQLEKKDKILGLISNSDVTEKIGWESSPLKDYFQVAIFSCDVGFVKPERQIYQICLEKLKVQPGESLFIGDGGSDELKGAKEIGLTTVLATWIIRDTWPEKIAQARPHADFVIKQISELIQ